MEALPLSGLVGGGARGAASADLARVLVLLRGVVATESATSEEAFVSAALGSGAGARQGGTTGDNFCLYWSGCSSLNEVASGCVQALTGTFRRLFTFRVSAGVIDSYVNYVCWI